MTSRLFTSGGSGNPKSMDIDPSLSFAFINFKTFTDEFDGASNFALLQNVDLDQKTNQQFILSLRQTIYLYIFGNQMGTVNVSGFLFASSCSSSDGFTKIMAFYSKHRLTSTEEPIEIAVGGVTFEGFLTGLKIQATNQKTLLTPFSMTIKLLPFDDELGESLNPSSDTDAGARGAGGDGGSGGGGDIDPSAVSASDSGLFK